MKTVFWIWQSWTGGQTRAIIKDAIDEALETLGFSPDVVERPEDATEIAEDARSTGGVSVDIHTGIMNGILESNVVIADISNTCRKPPSDADKAPRLTPNPNVMFEIGYAVGSSSTEKTILVANDFFGRDGMPFDIRQRTIHFFTYPTAEDGPTRKTVVTGLATSLSHPLKKLLSLPAVSNTAPAPMSAELRADLSQIQSDTRMIIESIGESRLRMLEVRSKTNALQSRWGLGRTATRRVFSKELKREMEIASQEIAVLSKQSSSAFLDATKSIDSAKDKLDLVLPAAKLLPLESISSELSSLSSRLSQISDEAKSIRPYIESGDLAALELTFLAPDSGIDFPTDGHIPLTGGNPISRILSNARGMLHDIRNCASSNGT